MNYHDWSELWWPILKKFGHEKDWVLEELILGKRKYNEDKPPTEDQKQLFKSLMGPHGHTILEILKIRAEQNDLCENQPCNPKPDK